MLTTSTKRSKCIVLLSTLLFLAASMFTSVSEAVQLQQQKKKAWANAYTYQPNGQGMFYKAEFNKKISLHLIDVPLEEALKVLAGKTGLSLTYRGDIMTRKKVTINNKSIGASTALRIMLKGTGLDYMFSRDGHLVINKARRRLQKAQTQEQIHGTVADAETGEPMPGVNIVIKGTTTGTTTNREGVYELTVSSLQDTLMFSFIGYETQQVPINGRTEINVSLHQQAVTGEEMVVIGYGQQSKEKITTAVSSVKSEDLATPSARDAAAMIKGKVAGLSIIESSGDPTEDSQISLRGTISLMGSSEPLVLIDGVPGDLRTVAPEQIESIDVLKAGAAAAIYGSRGSNGVIQITTKQNNRSVTRIQYDGYVDYQTIKAKPNLLNADEYRQHIVENNAGAMDFGNSTDWIDAITREPVSQSHTLTYMGGSGNTSFTGSLNYRNDKGIFLHSDNNRIIARTSLQHSMFDGELQTDINLTLRRRNYHQQSDGNSFSGYVYRQALIRNPTDRIYDDNGEYQIRQGFNYDNPLILLNEQGGEVQNKEMRLNGTVTWSPTPNLSLKFLGSTTRWVQERGYSETYDAISTRKGGTNAFASVAGGSRDDDLMELTGNFQKSFGSHNVDFLGGYSYQQVSNDSYYMSNQDFPSDLFGWHSIESGNALPEGKASMDSGKSSYKLIGFFGRLNYDWNDRYLLMGSVRYEGSSRFGANHKWGLFPAVSAGWRISEEDFMSDVSWLDDLKLRAGFGITGIVPTRPYQSLASFRFGENMFSKGQWIQGLTPARNPNPDLKWETKEEVNIGADFSVLDNRLSGSLDLYRRDSKDLLREIGVPVPPNLYGSMTENIGQVRNKGFEAMFDVSIVQQSDFQWNSTVTYSTNRNTLVKLSREGGVNTLTNGSMDEPLQMPSHRSHTGGPIGDLIGYKSVGIDEQGRWIVLDENGDQISIEDATPEDWRVIGNGIPDWNLGWTHSVRYKNFDLQLTMRGAFGFQISNWQRLYYGVPNYGTTYNKLEEAFDKVYGKTQLDYSVENVSYFVEDGDYWKIDNLTIGYTFDLDFVQNARVYVSGRNLLTITGYDGLDPEVNTTGLTPGLDQRDKYPTTRTFTLGLNLTF